MHTGKRESAGKERHPANLGEGTKSGWEGGYRRSREVGVNRITRASLGEVTTNNHK